LSTAVKAEGLEELLVLSQSSGTRNGSKGTRGFGKKTCEDSRADTRSQQMLTRIEKEGIDTRPEGESPRSRVRMEETRAFGTLDWKKGIQANQPKGQRIASASSELHRINVG